MIVVDLQQIVPYDIRTMIEVYTGARPGHPRLLLVAVMTLLVCSVVAAWVQVRESRALGEPVRIEGTPLVVRPPRGWVQSKRYPDTFLRPVRDSQGQAEIERRVEFGFVAHDTFVDPQRAAIELGLVDPANLYVRPTRIAGYDALQIRSQLKVNRGGVTLQRVRVVVIATLPRGEVIYISYLPLTQLTMGDFHILDDLAAAVRLEGVIDEPAESALARTGVRFPVEAGWRFQPPYVREVPGLHVSGMLGDRSGWALTIVRTWLSEGRTLVDLVRDRAIEEWLARPDETNPTDGRRDDGARIVTLTNPTGGTSVTPLAVYGIESSRTEVVLCILHADNRSFGPADEIARGIVDSLTFDGPPMFSNLEGAAKQGREIAEWIRNGGGRDWWGGRAVKYSYRYVGGTLDAERSETRVPDGAGYAGLELRQLDGRNLWRFEWKLDEFADGYSSSERFNYLNASVIVTETRRPSRVVRKSIEIDGESRKYRFEPGPNFVAAPAMPLVSARMAVAPRDAAVISTSRSLCSAATPMMLDTLPQDAEGLTRVLHRHDFDPLGFVAAYAERDDAPRWTRSGPHVFERLDKSAGP